MKNLENQLKQELEAREITPTPQAWERISTQIHRRDDKKRLVIVGAIAACVVIAATLFFLEETPVNPQSKSMVQSVKTPLNNPSLSSENKEEMVPQNYTRKALEIDASIAKPQSTQQKISPKVSVAHSNSIPNTVHKNIADFEVQNTKTPIIPAPLEDNKITDFSASPPMQIALNTPKKDTSGRRIKINREKLLFYIENERHIKKPSKIAFTNNSIQIDLNE